MSELEEAILKTLSYADVFDYPLTLEEIHRFLIAKRPFTLGEVSMTLNKLTDLHPPGERSSHPAGGALKSADRFYFLPGRREVVELRRSHQTSSQSKLFKAQKIARLLRFIPWIKMIGVTGKLAMMDCAEGDDIDLMTITAKGRLWLSRGLVVTFLRLTNQYRRPGKIKDRTCPNLFLDESYLGLPPEEQNLYTAHEIVQMKPLWEREGVYQKFLWANRWVARFLPNFQLPKIRSPRSVIDHLNHHPRRNLSIYQSINLSIIGLLERLAMKLQLKYMASKKTTEVTTPNIIRFHPQDAKVWVLEKYKKRLESLGPAFSSQR